MDYKQWNLRGLTFFEEEIIDSEDEYITNKYPSIKNFQQKNIYTLEIRHKLYNYLKNCPSIVAATYKRLNAYTLKHESSLTYFTDGEFIFTNLLQEYIYYDDFVLPERWYELIKNRNYINDHFKLDFERILSGEIDIFENIGKSFEEYSNIKGIIL